MAGGTGLVGVSSFFCGVSPPSISSNPKGVYLINVAAARVMIPSDAGLAGKGMSMAAKPNGSMDICTFSANVYRLLPPLNPIGS